MEQVVPDFVIPISANTEGKRAGDLPDKFLAALGDAGKNGDGATDGDEPEEALFVTHFLQVKTGDSAKKDICPRQKEADAQTGGAQVDQLRSTQTDSLFFRRAIGGGGFRFRFDGDFVGHNSFLIRCYCLHSGLVKF